ncbi:MAG TPA: type IV secretion system DNA-binding domain-containing protein [Streptosporangiaceae bacterium]|nr:type IV secretion system DNA-binding domain-containing protein [Streptosporangiaceae bacterium]
MSGPARPVGVTEAGGRFLAGLAVTDARYHLHMPGVTGTGKTTLLANMVLADARAGRGAVVLDPKGDMICDLLDRLPAAVAGRLVLIDPAETTAPAALNILDGPDPELAADQVVAIFRRIFAAWWGPRMDDILRCACLTLARVPDATLADVPALLTDPQARAALVRQVAGDPFLRGFWRWYDGLSEAGQAGAAGPVLSRLRAVLTRRFAADLLGAARSSFDMGKVLDGGLLLARLPKGLIGEDTARLAGSLIIARTGRPPWPAPRCPRPGAGTRPYTPMSATTSCTCPARWKTSSPKRAATGCRWSWPISTWTSSAPAWPPRCRRTRGTRSASPSTRPTPACWPARWGRC